MTGPEHYLEAERLLREIGKIPQRDDKEIPGLTLLVGLAQVHATLAHAAATAIATPDGEYSSDDDREWYEAAGLTSGRRAAP